jgi:hypothetical protein
MGGSKKVKLFSHIGILLDDFSVAARKATERRRRSSGRSDYLAALIGSAD